MQKGVRHELSGWEGPPAMVGAADQGEDWDAWQRPGPTHHQRRNDVWIALAVAAAAVISLLLVNSMGAFAHGPPPSLGEQITWVVALSVPLALRRHYPVVVLVVVSVIFIGAQARQVADNLVPSIALFIALYTVGAWARNRVAARWSRIGVIVAMFVWLGIGLVTTLTENVPSFDDAAGPLDPVLASVLHSLGFNVVFFLSPYFFGNVAWMAARRRRELEVQAEQLRRSQEENARQAVVAERLRIARDLHDVVAHHVSVMGVQAGAARRVFEVDHDQTRQSLATIEATARTAVAELRSLLGVLRAEGPQGAAAAGTDGTDESGEPSSLGLAQLPDLVSETRGTGLAVSYGVYGSERWIPDAIALSAYRVVQEALTNVVKHAEAASAEVRVRYLENSLEVEVTDSGQRRLSGTEETEQPQAGSGLGLVGMRERVGVHGGELEAGPRRSGGFRVRARFPLADDASEAIAAGGSRG